METNNNESVNDETIDNDKTVNAETIDNDKTVNDETIDNDELYTHPHENIRQNNETFEVELFDTDKQKWIKHPKSSSFENNKIRI